MIGLLRVESMLLILPSSNPKNPNSDDGRIEKYVQKRDFTCGSPFRVYTPSNSRRNSRKITAAATSSALPLRERSRFFLPAAIMLWVASRLE
jgi:hypothetical protein